MIAYRIADARHPIFDPTGPFCIVAAELNRCPCDLCRRIYAGALLEVLAHSNRSQPPKNHRVVRIDLPANSTSKPSCQVNSLAGFRRCYSLTHLRRQVVSREKNRRRPSSKRDYPGSRTQLRLKHTAPRLPNDSSRHTRGRPLGCTAL